MAQCVGEIVIDATNAPTSNDDIADVVWINYPYKYACRYPNQTISDLETQMFKEVNVSEKTWKLITPFRFEVH